MWVTEEISIDPGSQLAELILKVTKNFQDLYVFLVMNSAAVFSWEMGSWLVKTDVLLKRKITQEGKKQARKEAGCGENKSETNLFSRKCRESKLMQEQDWWKHRGISGGTHKMIQWDAKKTPITKVLRLLVQKTSSNGLRK